MVHRVADGCRSVDLACMRAQNPHARAIEILQRPPFPACPTLQPYLDTPLESTAYMAVKLRSRTRVFLWPGVQNVAFQLRSDGLGEGAVTPGNLASYLRVCVAGALESDGQDSD
jgi:hypothetical protein